MPNDHFKDEERAERKLAKQAERLEATSALFLRTSMATVEGRAYFLRWLERCHIFQNPYTGDALSTSYACGEMSIGQQILGDIMAYCPDQYILMMREREDGRRSTSNDRRSGSQSNGDGRDYDGTSDPGDDDPGDDDSTEAS